MNPRTGSRVEIGDEMDCEATLAFPLALVFAHLSTPALLGDWLSDVVRVGSTPLVPAGIGVTFGLTLCREERDLAATGEVIAYEPPAMTAYLGNEGMTAARLAPLTPSAVLHRLGKD
jgi:hypothetical protein